MNHVHSRMAIQHHPYWSSGGIPHRPAQNEFNNFRCEGKFERSLTSNQIQTYSKKATLEIRFSVANTNHHRPTLIPLPSLSGSLHMIMALGATGKLTKIYSNYHTTPIWMPHLIRCSSISVLGWSNATNSAWISNTVPFLAAWIIDASRVEFDDRWTALKRQGSLYPEIKTIDRRWILENYLAVTCHDVYGQCGSCNLKFVQGSLTAANTVSLPDPLTDFCNENLYPDVEKKSISSINSCEVRRCVELQKGNNQINRIITVQIGGQGHDRCFINSKSMMIF